MILSPTPDVRLDLIRVGTAIRKSPDILRAYLKHLHDQRIPPGCRIEYHFILDTDDQESKALIHEFVKDHGGLVEEAEGTPQDDFSDDHPITHQWTGQAMARVGQLKNRILQKALQDAAEAVWFVDADLLCDSGTLRSLWFANKPVVSAVFWTRWTPDSPALPQVWLRHPYELSGRGYPDEAAFRRQLMTRELTEVWGGGACVLIRRQVLEAGITYDYVPGIELVGVMAGEDRHFCIRCELQHIKMYADPWPHIAHIYHPSDRQFLPEAEEMVGKASIEGMVLTPEWMNLSLKLLEPVQTGPGAFVHPEPVNVRVRVGKGEILPDLEKQCLEHREGETFIAQVYFPRWYPVAAFREKRKLIEVTVVDVKSNAPIPVLKDDLPKGYDVLEYTPEQLEGVVNV